MALAIKSETVSPKQDDFFSYYEENGYVVVPDMLADSEINVLREALTEVLQRAQGLTESNDEFSIAQGTDGRYQVRRVIDPIAQHQAFLDAARHPRILDAVERLIGPNIELHHSKLNLKPPSSPNARFPWHQDYPFFPHTNYDLLAVLIHLDDANQQNGCLRVIPGSHHGGPRAHRFAVGGAFTSELEDVSVAEDASQWAYAEATAGGVEIHHCNMIHSSTANLGNEPRSVLIFQYRAADNVALAGGMDRPGFGMLVRGATVNQARFLDGTMVALPGEISDPLQRDG